MHNRVGERGATLLDVVVGSALMTLVFVGIVGAFKLAIDAVSNNSARAGAIALTTERLEYIRSLDYDDIGTVGGIPAGALVQVATSTLNNITYTRRTFVSWEDDPQDGTGLADSNGIVTDYKAAKVSVSWQSRQGTRTITMATRISPPTGMEQAVPGGTLSFVVTNDADQPLQNVPVRVMNSTVVPSVDLSTYTDSAGRASILGAPPGASYAIIVTQSGYSTSQTYSANGVNTNPNPAHLGVALNQTTEMNFEIDTLSNVVVETYEPIEDAAWTDLFANGSLIATTSLTSYSTGDVRLAGNEGTYAPSGTVMSTSVTDPYLYAWDEMAWDDTVPAGTAVLYRLYDGNSALIPDSVLPGNGAGITTSPINLSSVSTTTYPQLRIGATLTTSDSSSTPVIDSWAVRYQTGPTPIPNVDFNMRGAKTIGSGPAGPVYKYDVTSSSGPSGAVTLQSIEYDSYTISVPASEGYDIASSCLPQPTVVAPGATMASRLYLMPHTANSLLVDVKNPSGTTVPDASVRLYRGAFTSTIETDQCGQSFFSGIAAGSVGGDNPYSVEVTAPGYTTFTSSEVNAVGTARLSVILNN